MVELNPDYLPSYQENLRERFTKKMIKDWDRALPLSEMLLDRWKRAELLGFGKMTSVYDNAYIYGLSNLTVGERCWIGPNTIIDASGAELVIGDGVSIACGAMLFTHSAHEFCVTEGKKPFLKAPIEIGDHAFIGSGAIILPGVRIGDHATVAAGAVVTKDVKPRTTVGGIPAKVIK